MTAGAGGESVGYGMLPRPSAQLAALAARLTAALDATTNTKAAEHGLHRADFDVLVALRDSGAEFRLRPTEVSERCRLSSGGTSKVVRRMTESGYVVREADLYDGRSSLVQLTEEGLRIVTSIQDEVDAVHTALLDRLSLGVVDALCALLEQSVAVLEEDR